MDSVDPGSYLSSLGATASRRAAPAPADLDSQIMQLLKQTAPEASTDDSAAQNTKIAQSVTPQGSNRAMTWLKNAPATAGGEFYKLYKNVTGQKLDPLQQSVLDQAKQASPGVAPATDILATAPIAMGVGEGLPALGAMRGMGLLGQAVAKAPVMGAIQGGIQGAATANPGDRLKQGLLGAATGAALPVVGGAIGKLASGAARTPEAQQLVNQGVQLPLGMMSPSGAVNKLEQAATNLPFVGSKIANARAAVAPQITERMVQDAAAPGATLPKGLGINDAVSELKNGYDSAYDAAIGGYPGKAAIMRTQGADIPLNNAFTAVVNKARPGLTAQARASLGQTLQGQLQEVINAARQGGGLQLTDLQQFRSTLRTLGREAPEGTTNEAVRGFWKDAEDKVTQAIESQLPPKSAAALQAIDQQYGKFATVRNLAVSVKDREPNVLDWSNAIKRATPPPVYAAGGGWNRDLIKAASAVVKPTVPQTGATGAGMVGPAMHGLEGAGTAMLAYHNPIAGAGLAGGLGALYGAYTRPGMRFLAGQTRPQQAVTGLMNSINPSIRQGAGLLTRSSLLQGLMGGQSQASFPLLQAAAQ